MVSQLQHQWSRLLLLSANDEGTTCVYGLVDSGKAFAHLLMVQWLNRTELVLEVSTLEVNSMRGDTRRRIIATFLLIVVLFGGTFGGLSAAAQRRHYRRPHHSRAKGALIGGAVGLIGGALLGGKKGALIGAGAGAGTGYLIQRHRNRRHRRYYTRSRRNHGHYTRH